MEVKKKKRPGAAHYLCQINPTVKLSGGSIMCGGQSWIAQSTEISLGKTWSKVLRSSDWAPASPPTGKWLCSQSKQHIRGLCKCPWVVQWKNTQWELNEGEKATTEHNDEGKSIWKLNPVHSPLLCCVVLCSGAATARDYSRRGMNWQTSTTAWTNPLRMWSKWTACRTPSSAPMSMGFEDTPRKYKSRISCEIISMNENN